MTCASSPTATPTPTEACAHAPVTRILLANPRGFCAGVERAIAIVERALERFGAPIYVRHEVVHNRFVCDNLRRKGAIFIEELSEVPVGSTLIFSAHGVSQAVRAEALARNCKIFDATCPLVTKVHVEVGKMRRAERQVIMIGHAGHPEVEGTMGQSEDGMFLVEHAKDVEKLTLPREAALSFVTQTTLSVDDAQNTIAALRERFPHIQGPKKNDICFATQNRQDAVRALAQECELIIVVGSPNSSNSRRLREVAADLGVHAELIDNDKEIKAEWLTGCRNIGVTAGASAPEVLVNNVITRLQTLLPASRVDKLAGREENVNFPLPHELL